MSIPVPDMNSAQNPRYYEITELDADERNAIKRVNEALERTLAKMTSFDIPDQMKYETEAINRYNEIGYEIDITWERLPSPLPSLTALQPLITILGKLFQHETDYDKIKHDIVTGRVDGQAGYVREDGTLREDPKKKTIY